MRAIVERDYKKLRKAAIKNGHLNINAHDSSNSYTSTKSNRYYYPTRSGKYKVSKVIDGRTIDFGIYKDKREAKYVINRLKDCGWDKSKFPSILNDLQVLKRKWKLQE